MNSSRPKRLEKLPWRDIDGCAVVLQPAQARIHELNPVGSFLWSKADGVSSIQEIAAELAEHFEIDAETAARDAMEFYQELSTLGIISDAHPI